jgi:hypothetical protein
MSMPERLCGPGFPGQHEGIGSSPGQLNAHSGCFGTRYMLCLMWTLSEALGALVYVPRYAVVAFGIT